MREETGARKTTYDGFKEADDAALLVNTVNWLATQENYTDFTQVNGLELDNPTALLAFEEPAASTEPQAEPWLHLLQATNGMTAPPSNQAPMADLLPVPMRPTAS